MKKVGIITIHSPYNYGAALQAYATQKAVSDTGADCKIIDFSTWDTLQNNQFFCSGFTKKSIKHNVRNVLKAPSFFKRKAAFERFKTRYMQLTDTSYTSDNIGEVKQEGFDCIITGSDQTLNLNLGTHSIDREIFYLPFINVKKISYAASMGEHIGELTDVQESFIKTALSDYSHLSVREEVCADKIESILSVRPEIVADPTLAIPRKHWESILAPVSGLPEKYILFYTVLSAPWVVEYVKKLSRETGLPVVAAHPQNAFEMGANFQRADRSGPAEFFSLIKNAELVVTSSFHGTVFSTIFARPFVSLILGEGNRISAFLSHAGLECRGFRSTPDNIDLYNVDFTRAEEFLAETKQANLDFLKRSIN